MAGRGAELRASLAGAGGGADGGAPVRVVRHADGGGRSGGRR